MTWSAVAAAGALALSIGGLWLQKEHGSLPKPVTTRLSLAVVPIANPSVQPWISTAVSEAFGTDLSGGGQIRVTAPAEVAQAMRGSSSHACGRHE